MARILVVDDSLAAGKQLERLLVEQGAHEVVCQARNGAEALKCFVEHAPELVMLDIVMPVMDGLQALRAILGRDPSAKVIMVSSVGGVGEKVGEALRLGARAVVSKPFEADDVLATVERVLAEGE